MGVGAGLYMYDVVVKTFTFAISSTDEFLQASLTALEAIRLVAYDFMPMFSSSDCYVFV